MNKLYIVFFFLTTYSISAQLMLNEVAFNLAPGTTTHGIFYSEGDFQLKKPPKNQVFFIFSEKETNTIYRIEK